MARVLVVDDCPNIRKMLCEMLAMEGYQTLEAANGEQGLEMMWKSEEPLIVVLDFMMPRMAGVDTLRYLAEDPKRARRHGIVLMSGNFDYPDRAAQVFPHAPLPFLGKPFTFDRLLDAINKAEARLTPA